MAKKKAPAKKAPAKKKKATKKSKEPLDGLAAFEANIRKGFGEGVMARGSALAEDIPRISTGNLGLDIATFGGLPRGRIIRFFGREKSAKTGSCLNTMAAWQKHCGLCYERGPCEHGTVSGVDRPKAAGLWIDAEHRLDSMMGWVKGHGVDADRLLVMEPPSGQHIVDITDAAIREHGAGIGLIVVDSIANITSQEELSKATMKGRTAPVNALLLNKALRKWIAAVNELGVHEKRKPTILLINQIRHTMDAFGNPEVMPGGKGQDYATSLDVRFSKSKPHYLVETPSGWEDKSVAYGSRWKPDADVTPDYVEINYRVTASGICPNGRHGTFNYWTKAGHGRRKGDPDNEDRLWEYARKYLMKKAETGTGWTICSATEKTQAKLKEVFYLTESLRMEAWAEVVSILMKV